MKDSTRRNLSVGPVRCSKHGCRSFAIPRETLLVFLDDGLLLRPLCRRHKAAFKALPDELKAWTSCQVEWLREGDYS